MARVLVTGASGFIGSHLVQALVARGQQVTALVRSSSSLERIRPLGVRLVYGDMGHIASLRAAVAGQSVVYHVAGLNRALRAAQFHQVNQQGTRNIAQACAQQTTPPVLVVVSSLAAAGPSPPDRLRTEADPASPVSNYGRSKRAGEKAAQQFASQVPITIVRPPIVFGEADKQGLALFRTVARFHVHLVPGYAPRRFSLIHAADLAELLIRAAQCGQRLRPADQQEDRPCQEGYYFAASSEHPTYYQLGRMVGQALGHRWTLCIPFASPAVWSVAAVGELIGQIRRRPVLLGIDKAREATAGSWACSAQKAAHELGFRPAVGLVERLRQTAQWYRRQGWL